MKKNIFFFIAFLIFSTNVFAFIISLPDGSKKSAEGEIIKGPSYKGYQKALEQYLNGEQVTDWPVVTLNNKGKPKKEKGYMGEKILEEGAPLFELPKTFKKLNPAESIAVFNGLAPEDFSKVLVGLANDDWKKEKDISEEVANVTENFTKSIVSSNFDTYKIYKITEDISKYGNKTFKENSKQNLKVTEKLQEFYGLDDVNEAKELLNTIQSKRIEINELDLNKSEKKALLQGELKINIERKIEKPIQDFGSTSVKLNEVIENNNKLDQKTLTEINSVKKDLTVNQIALNIENYKKIIDQSGIQSENKLSDKMLAAISSWEENPGEILNNFVNLVEGLDLEEAVQLSEEFNQSVRNSIEILGNGDLDLGLKQIEFSGLNNEFSKMMNDQLSGEVVDEVQMEAVREEIQSLEQELGIGASGQSFGTAYFNDCDCTRDVTQEDMDNRDPETGQFR